MGRGAPFHPESFSYVLLIVLILMAFTIYKHSNLVKSLVNVLWVLLLGLVLYLFIIRPFFS